VFSRESALRRRPSSPSGRRPALSEAWNVPVWRIAVISSDRIDDNDDEDDKSERDSSWKSRRAKVLPVVVRLCQLDGAGRRRRSVVVSGTPTTTWRFPRSNEAEASLHADARRLGETAAQETTRAGRANPPRPGVETARHGTSGTWRKCAICYFAPSRRVIDASSTGRVDFTSHVRRCDGRRKRRIAVENAFKVGHVVSALFIEIVKDFSLSRSVKCQRHFSDVGIGT